MKTEMKYTAACYSAEKITGHYVRVEGEIGKFRFKHFETTGTNGQGPTLREYYDDGTDLPLEIREKAIQTKKTVKVE